MPAGARRQSGTSGACPDEKVRDGKQALLDAKRACELTYWKWTGGLEAFAAACAETGDFDEAVRWQTWAVASLTNAKQPDEAAQTRLDLYKDHKPYRADVPIALPGFRCEPGG